MQYMDQTHELSIRPRSFFDQVRLEHVVLPTVDPVFENFYSIIGPSDPRLE